MQLNTLRRDLKAIEQIEKIILATDIDIYLTDDVENDLFHNLIEKIKLEILDELSIKELALYNNRMSK